MPQVYALTFIKGYRPLVFHLPFWTGIAFAVVMQLSTSPCCKASLNVTGFNIGSGKYSNLLGFNVVATVVCWGLAAIALLDNRSGRGLEGEEDCDVGIGGGGDGGVVGKVHGGSVKGNSLLGLPVPKFLLRQKGNTAGPPTMQGVGSKDVDVVVGGTTATASAGAGGVAAAAPLPTPPATAAATGGADGTGAVTAAQQVAGSREV